MNRNLVGSIYGRSSIKNSIFVPMSNLNRGPSIDASYHVSAHLAKQFQRRRFVWNRPIRNKNCMWWPCFLTDRDKQSSPLKSLSQMKWNLVGSIYGRSSIKIARFVPIRWQTWLPQGIFVSDRLISFFIENLPRMPPTEIRFIWPSGFRGDNFLEINQSETRIVCGDHVCQRIGTKWAIFIENLPRMLRNSCFWLADFFKLLLWNRFAKWTKTW
jgi:hypothetical protein